MIITGSVKVLYKDMQDGFPYDKLYHALKKLYDNSNRNNFMVCADHYLFDSEYYGTEDDVGNVVGRKIYIKYDDVIGDIVEKILKKYGAV